MSVSPGPLLTPNPSSSEVVHSIAKMIFTDGCRQSTHLKNYLQRSANCPSMFYYISPTIKVFSVHYSTLTVQSMLRRLKG